MKIMATSFKRSQAHTAILSAPDPAAGHYWPTPPPETPGHSRASLGQSLVGSLLLSSGSWYAQGSVCALQGSVSPVPCKFWWFYDRVNGDLLHEGLCHSQVCCTQSPCRRPLLTRTSTGDTHIQFWLSICGLGMCFMPVPGLSSWGGQVLSAVRCPRRAVHLNHLPSPSSSLSWVRGESTVSGGLCVSSGALISGCDPPGGCQPSRISGRRG